MKASTFIRSFLFALAVLIAVPGFSQDERERPNTARGQIGLTRQPRISDGDSAVPRDRVFFNYDYFEAVDVREGGDSTAPMDEESRRRFDRVVGGFVRKFKDQQSRYDDLKKKIEDEKKKPRSERDRAKISDWEKKLKDIAKENADTRKKFGFTSDEVKDEVKKEITKDATKTAQDEENRKAREGGREPKTITNPPMPHGNPPVLD